jgi:hypothetical protein
VIGNFYVEPVEPTAKFYVTGNAALVGQDKEWNPAAVASMADTLELNLEANVDYILKVTLNGTWEGENNVKGYNELTEKTPGLLDISNDHNIGFKLNEAGVVKVVYIAAEGENPEIFKVIGNFSTDVPVILPTVAIAGAMNGWDATANVMTPAEGNLTASVTMTLDAHDYNFKVVVDGQWRCYVDQLYDITRANATLPGVDQEGGYNDNFNLKADAAGEYTFTWTYATNTLEITFPEAGPIEPTAKFYVTGNAALVGQDKEWNPAAIASMADTLELNLEANIDYVLKVTLNGTWEGENNVKGYNELTEVADGLKDISNDHNIGFKLAEAGVVQVIYTAEVFKLVGNFVTDAPQTLDNGYYLVGSMNDWTPAAEYFLVQNPENEAEYELDINLNVNDEIKVVYVENDAIVTWYPDEGDNYVIDDHHNGETTLYFRPDYLGGDDWFAGCIYVVPTSTVGFDNVDADAKAIKQVINGKLFILRGDKTYTVDGQIVR